MTEIFALHLMDENAFEQLREQLLEKLPDAVKVKITAFARPADAQRSLAGELATRYLLASRFGKTLPYEPFTTGEKGKPFPDGFENIHFNISHSGKWVAIAFSDTAVGVDVEKIRRVPEGVANRFFSQPEKDWINSCPDETSKADVFFTLWTLKESFLKAIGKGLTKNLNSFTVSPIADGNFLLENDPEAHGYSLKNFQFEEGYKLSACSYGDLFDASVTILNLHEIINAHNNLK